MCRIPCLILYLADVKRVCQCRASNASAAADAEADHAPQILTTLPDTGKSTPLSGEHGGAMRYEMERGMCATCYGSGWTRGSWASAR